MQYATCRLQLRCEYLSAEAGRPQTACSRRTPWLSGWGRGSRAGPGCRAEQLGWWARGRGRAGGRGEETAMERPLWRSTQTWTGRRTSRRSWIWTRAWQTPQAWPSPSSPGGAGSRGRCGVLSWAGCGCGQRGAGRGERNEGSCAAPSQRAAEGSGRCDAERWERCGGWCRYTCGGLRLARGAARQGGTWGICGGSPGAAGWGQRRAGRSRAAPAGLKVSGSSLCLWTVGSEPGGLQPCRVEETHLKPASHPANEKSNETLWIPM